MQTITRLFLQIFLHLYGTRHRVVLVNISFLAFANGQSLIFRTDFPKSGQPK